MAPAYIPVFLSQKPSTKTGIIRPAILFLAWVPRVAWFTQAANVLYADGESLLETREYALAIEKLEAAATMNPALATGDMHISLLETARMMLETAAMMAAARAASNAEEKTQPEPEEQSKPDAGQAAAAGGWSDETYKVPAGFPVTEPAAGGEAAAVGGAAVEGEATPAREECRAASDGEAACHEPAPCTYSRSLFVQGYLNNSTNAHGWIAGGP